MVDGSISPAIDESDFKLIIVDPDKVIFDGKVKRLIAPGVFQDLAILPNHTPLYAQLQAGDVLIDPVSSAAVKIAIDGGIIRVKANKVSIIVGFETKDAPVPVNPSSKPS